MRSAYVFSGVYNFPGKCYISECSLKKVFTVL